MAYVAADGVQYVISNRPRLVIEAFSDVNGGAFHGVTYDKWEGVLGSAKTSQAALPINENAVKNEFVAFKFWQIIA